MGIISNLHTCELTPKVKEKGSSKFVTPVLLLFILVIQIPANTSLVVAQIALQGYGFQLNVPNSWTNVSNDETNMIYVSQDRTQGVVVMMFSLDSWTLNDYVNNSYNTLISGGVDKNAISVSQTMNGPYPAVVLDYPNGKIQFTQGNDVVYLLQYSGDPLRIGDIGFSVVDVSQQQLSQQQIDQQLKMLSFQVQMQGMNESFRIMDNFITCMNPCETVFR